MAREIPAWEVCDKKILSAYSLTGVHNWIDRTTKENVGGGRPVTRKAAYCNFCGRRCPPEYEGDVLERIARMKLSAKAGR